MSEVFRIPTQEADETVSSYKPTKVYSIETSPHFAPEPIPIDDLYREALAMSPALRNALRLLAEAKDAVSDALAATKTGNPLAADDAMHGLQAVLPELFCCREIGDGFGAIANALKFSFVNQQGMPFSVEQIRVIDGVLKKLRTEPFLRFDTAVKLIVQLEDSGLAVDPPMIAAIGSLLDDI